MALVVAIDSQAEPSSWTLRRWDVEADSMFEWRVEVQGQRIW